MMSAVHTICKLLILFPVVFCSPAKESQNNFLGAVGENRFLQRGAGVRALDQFDYDLPAAELCVEQIKQPCKNIAEQVIVGLAFLLSAARGIKPVEYEDLGTCIEQSSQTSCQTVSTPNAFGCVWCPTPESLTADFGQGSCILDIGLGNVMCGAVGQQFSAIRTDIGGVVPDGKEQGKCVKLTHKLEECVDECAICEIPVVYGHSLGGVYSDPYELQGLCHSRRFLFEDVMYPPEPLPVSTDAVSEAQIIATSSSFLKESTDAEAVTVNNIGLTDGKDVPVGSTGASFSSVPTELEENRISTPLPVNEDLKAFLTARNIPASALAELESLKVRRAEDELLPRKGWCEQLLMNRIDLSTPTPTVTTAATGSTEKEATDTKADDNEGSQTTSSAIPKGLGLASSIAIVTTWLLFK